MSKTTTSPLLWLPSAGDGIQLTPSATAWADNTWTELTSSAPSDIYAAYLAVLPNDGSTMTAASVEIDIGTGAGGAEVPLITVRVRAQADQWGPLSTVPLGLIYSRITSGTRVALRVRHSLTADTDVYRVALGYFSTLGGATGYSTGSPSVTPTGSSTATVTAGGSAWTYGSWTEILPAASVTVPLLISGIVCTSIDDPHEIQIGFGAAASEVVRLGPFPYGNTGTTGNGFHYARFPRPLYVPAGTRVALRTRAGTASVSFTGHLWHVAA